MSEFYETAADFPYSLEEYQELYSNQGDAKSHSIPLLPTTVETKINSRGECIVSVKETYCLKKLGIVSFISGGSHQYDKSTIHSNDHHQAPPVAVPFRLFTGKAGKHSDDPERKIQFLVLYQLLFDVENKSSSKNKEQLTLLKSLQVDNEILDFILHTPFSPLLKEKAVQDYLALIVKHNVGRHHLSSLLSSSKVFPFPVYEPSTHGWSFEKISFLKYATQYLPPPIWNVSVPFPIEDGRQFLSKEDREKVNRQEREESRRRVLPQEAAKQKKIENVQIPTKHEKEKNKVVEKEKEKEKEKTEQEKESFKSEKSADEKKEQALNKLNTVKASDTLGSDLTSPTASHASLSSSSSSSSASSTSSTNSSISTTAKSNTKKEFLEEPEKEKEENEDNEEEEEDEEEGDEEEEDEEDEQEEKELEVVTHPVVPEKTSVLPVVVPPAEEQDEEEEEEEDEEKEEETDLYEN